MSADSTDTIYVKVYLNLLCVGMTPGEIFSVLQKSGYGKTRMTLHNQIKRLKATDDGEHVCKSVGRKQILNEEEMDKVHMWILDKNENHIPIERKDVKKYIHNTFGLEVTDRTAGNIVHRLELSRKTCQMKTAGFKYSNAELREMYWNFILEMKAKRKFGIPLSQICSIDITHTTRPAGKVTTISSIGGGKQKCASKVVLYTNSIVTFIWADRVNRTPCMLFTYDPKFNPEQKKTSRGKLIKTELDTALDKYGVSRHCVVYKSNKKNYCGEAAELYEYFLDYYEIDKNVLILHDGGNAFKRGKTSIFDAKGFTNHLTYPAAVHQYLSPNDNKLHGVKAKWKKKYWELGDSISPSLYLMQLIDCDNTKHSYRYFQNNLIKVSKASLDGIIGW
jgi:transposase